MAAEEPSPLELSINFDAERNSLVVLVCGPKVLAGITSTEEL